MISVPETVVECVASALGETVAERSGSPSMEAAGLGPRRIASEGTGLFDLMLRAAEKLPGGFASRVGGVVAATFSNESRFPPLSVRLASALGVSPSAPAFDVQMACSAYPYAVYLASRISQDTGKSVLVFDGDVQSRLVDPADPATAPLFSDAATATLVRSGGADGATSAYAFLSRASDALSCAADGPIRMDGFAVFSFVAAEVAPFLKSFIADPAAGRIDGFVPHQANMYMVRRLARAIGMEKTMLATGELYANAGSCTIPLTLAEKGKSGRYLVAGFGAGLSASAGVVRLA